MKSTLHILTLFAFVGTLTLSSISSAADASGPQQPQKQNLSTGHHALGTSYMNDHFVSYGDKITMTLAQKPADLEASKQLFGKIADGTHWKVITTASSSKVSGALSLFRPTADQMTPALIQISSTIGSGGHLNLKPNSEVTFHLGTDGLYLVSSGEKHLIITNKEIQTVQTFNSGSDATNIAAK